MARVSSSSALPFHPFTMFSIGFMDRSPFIIAWSESLIRIRALNAGLIVPPNVSAFFIATSGFAHSPRPLYCMLVSAS